MNGAPCVQVCHEKQMKQSQGAVTCWTHKRAPLSALAFLQLRYIFGSNTFPVTSFFSFPVKVKTGLDHGEPRRTALSTVRCVLSKHSFYFPEDVGEAILYQGVSAG